MMLEAAPRVLISISAATGYGGMTTLTPRPSRISTPNALANRSGPTPSGDLSNASIERRGRAVPGLAAGALGQRQADDGQQSVEMAPCRQVGVAPVFGAGKSRGNQQSQRGTDWRVTGPQRHRRAAPFRRTDGDHQRRRRCVHQQGNAALNDTDDLEWREGAGQQIQSIDRCADQGGQDQGGAGAEPINHGTGQGAENRRQYRHQ